MRRLVILTVASGLVVTAGNVPAASGALPLRLAQGEGFNGTIERIDAELRENMTGVSWHRGCPVPIRKLRLLGFNYWGFEGGAHRGRLVVNRTQAREILVVFEALFDAAFPFKRVRLVEGYDADDQLLGKKDVTSAFNCRFATGNPGVWSQHAYGLAIDINPVQNPYVDGDDVSPPRGRRYLDRTLQEPGMVHEGDVVVDAFAAIDWKWGGNWTSLKDYMHFSLTGN